LPIAGCEAPRAERSDASAGLVFIRRAEGNSDLMRVRISDGATRYITRSANSNERWPYWSEASGQLVYQREEIGGREGSRLFLWDPELDTPKALSPSRDREERWPVWSPDGERLVYAFMGQRPAAGILSVSLGDGKVTLLAHSGPSDFFFRPSFSPDGRSLLVQRRGEDGSGSSVWILAPDSDPRPVTGDPDWFDMKPWFTRSGDSVVFSRRPVSGGNHDIFSVAAAGGAVRSIVATASDEQSARPSPTRDELAFVSNRGGSYDAFLSALDGSNVRRLVDSPDRDEHAPRWSPDGDRLVVTTRPTGAADSGNAEDLHIVVLDRSGKILLDIPGEMADWMPPWR
jgi:Tol biopolymer transport system component